MQKGFSRILITIAIMAVILFLPIPGRYTTEVACLPCPLTDPSKCTSCPKKGDFGLGPSLGQRIIFKISEINNKRRQSINYIKLNYSPSPTPLFH